MEDQIRQNDRSDLSKNFQQYQTKLSAKFQGYIRIHWCNLNLSPDTHPQAIRLWIVMKELVAEENNMIAMLSEFRGRDDVSFSPIFDNFWPVIFFSVRCCSLLWAMIFRFGNIK